MTGRELLRELKSDFFKDDLDREILVEAQAPDSRLGLCLHYKIENVSLLEGGFLCLHLDLNNPIKMPLS